MVQVVHLISQSSSQGSGLGEFRSHRFIVQFIGSILSCCRSAIGYYICPVFPDSVNVTCVPHVCQIQGSALRQDGMTLKLCSDKAWIKHQTLCTPYNPFKPAGTSLGKESRSVKMAPGKISGTHHKQAVLPGRRSAVRTLQCFCHSSLPACQLLQSPNLSTQNQYY